MRTLLLLILFSTACGNIQDKRVKRKHKPPTPTNYIVVGKATITISNGCNFCAVNPVNANVTYTEPERGKFEVTPNIVASEDVEGTLNLGTLAIDKIDVNKLEICGVGGDEKCTSSIIRMYTTAITGHPGIAGFVNTIEGYGLDFTADSVTIGLDTGGATTLNQYTIPAGDRRLRNNDFTDLSYDLEVDLENAGVGNYEMDIVLELLVGS